MWKGVQATCGSGWVTSVMAVGGGLGTGRYVAETGTSVVQNMYVEARLRTHAGHTMLAATCHGDVFAISRLFPYRRLN